ncbi:hypothetical protein V490_05881 [Pseudogymnoascus sp. VKM F-3557]|nr:hypothetical protein V490_05881 [Pseudogymnoascus sp. VKM F-3557]
MPISESTRHKMAGRGSESLFTTQVHGAIRSDMRQVVPEEDEACRDCTYGTRTVVAAAEEANPLNALSVGAIYSEDVVVSAMFVDMTFQVCGAETGSAVENGENYLATRPSPAYHTSMMQYPTRLSSHPSNLATDPTADRDGRDTNTITNNRRAEPLLVPTSGSARQRGRLGGRQAGRNPWHQPTSSASITNPEYNHTEHNMGIYLSALIGRLVRFTISVRHTQQNQLYHELKAPISGRPPYQQEREFNEKEPFHAPQTDAERADIFAGFLMFSRTPTSFQCDVLAYFPPLPPLGDFKTTYWTETLALAILNAITAAIEAGVLLGAAKEVVKTAKKDVEGWIGEHPVMAGVAAMIVALGVLVVVAPWVVEGLGFGGLGVRLGSFAARWQSRKDNERKSPSNWDPSWSTLIAIKYPATITLGPRYTYHKGLRYEVRVARWENAGSSTLLEKCGDVIKNRRQINLPKDIGLAGVATLFVVARLATRLWLVKKSTWDDFMIVVSWFLALGVSLSIAIGVRNGLGRNDADIPAQWRDDLRKCEYAFSVLYNPALMATKTSILIFYLRLSKNKKYFRLATYLTMAVIIVGGTTLTFLSIFACHPITKTFSNSTTQKCIRLVTLYFAATPINVVTDAVILILPIPILTGMQLPRKQKIILVLLFALGIFVMVVDVIRIDVLQDTLLIITAGGHVPTLTNTLEDTTNFAYLVSPALMWSAVEINIGIVCACIPTLRPLVRKVVPWLIGRVGTHSSDGSSRLASTSEHPTSDAQNSTGGSEAVTSPIKDRPTHPGAPDSDIQMDFLAQPKMENSATARQQTKLPAQHEGTALYFGLINLEPPKCMLRMSVSDSWKYCSVVTILFFMWGFSCGLLNALNVQISIISHFTTKQSLSLHTAFYGGYLIGPFTVGWYALKMGGFKIIFIVGLCIYGIGTLMLWPSASFVSLPGFLVSNVVTAIGISSLELAANPFITLCGPPQYGEMRLLFAQAMQAVGVAVSELIADKAFAPLIRKKMNLVHVQWSYFSIALFTIVVALFFYYMPLPEASDEELEHELQTHLLPTDTTARTTPSSIRIGGMRVIFLTLALGAMVQSIYLLSLEAMNIWYIYVLAPPTAEQKIDDLDISPRNYVLLGYSMMFFSRLIAGVLCLVMRPRLILLGCLIGTLAFTIGFVALPGDNLSNNPNLVAGLGIMMFFFLAPVFPLVYAITLRGMGNKTRLAAAVLTASNCLGTVGPWIIFGAMRSWSIRGSFWVMILLFGIALMFPVYLCVVKKARSVVDCNVTDRQGCQWPGSQRRQSGVLDMRRRRSDEDEERDWRRLSGWGSWGGEKTRRASAVSAERVKKIVVMFKEWAG